MYTVDKINHLAGKYEVEGDAQNLFDLMQAMALLHYASVTEGDHYTRIATAAARTTTELTARVTYLGATSEEAVTLIGSIVTLATADVDADYGALITDGTPFDSLHIGGHLVAGLGLTLSWDAFNGTLDVREVTRL